jgi:hypothetical protein
MTELPDLPEGSAVRVERLRNGTRLVLGGGRAYRVLEAAAGRLALACLLLAAFVATYALIEGRWLRRAVALGAYAVLFFGYVVFAALKRFVMPETVVLRPDRLVHWHRLRRMPPLPEVQGPPEGRRRVEEAWLALARRGWRLSARRDEIAGVSLQEFERFRFVMVDFKRAMMIVGRHLGPEDASWLRDVLVRWRREGAAGGPAGEAKAAPSREAPGSREGEAAAGGAGPPETYE